jgi:hypothetical protein
MPNTDKRLLWGIGGGRQTPTQKALSWDALLLVLLLPDWNVCGLAASMFRSVASSSSLASWKVFQYA